MRYFAFVKDGIPYCFCGGLTSLSAHIDDIIAVTDPRKLTDSELTFLRDRFKV